jgi:hypothetical protein
MDASPPPIPPAVIRIFDRMATDRQFGFFGPAAILPPTSRRKRARVCTGCRRPKYQAATVRCGCSPHA